MRRIFWRIRRYYKKAAEQLTITQLQWVILVSLEVFRLNID